MVSFAAAMELYKDFTFEAAHFLPKVGPQHKCRIMHGHSYKLTVFVSGPVNPDTGWIIDFNEIKATVKPLVDQLDHQILNEQQGLENPTCENMAIWFWDHIKPSIPQLSKITIAETATSGCSYTGK